ncbi:RNA polymerase sigma factor [Actinacidiphila rubida]|uniref:RNA polymerase sigma-70 factor, ECF subfamily n=1 Tax=Actinacidiphila rubida TaxID=310780 RepID=A0A1H8JK34_9ACTN|nr:RNA polymerase sigma factor [Actinacidiphila rubida]SEN81134.1 RNA polymerase sigma-70 factor, ECF subfamily [Actinacidiphila rubida]
MDDDELIARLAGGDENALRELFGRHAPWLAARLRAALPARDVEDVLQETFLAVWRSAPDYRPQGSPGGWLWVIARRQAAGWLRRHGHDASPVDTAGLDDTALDGALAAAGRAAARDPVEAVMARTDLAAALAVLGPQGSPEREVWRLLYVEDRPVAQVARALGVPQGTVKSRAHRVRRLMRTALAGRAAQEEGL